MQLYDHLSRFPLFQGLSHNEMIQLIGTTKFAFVKADAGSVVAREGKESSGISLLTDGELTLSHRSDNHSFRLVEYIQAPKTLYADTIFGLSTHFRYDVAAVTPCSFVIIPKKEMMRILGDFLIIRLNLLNILSSAVQRDYRQQWRHQSATVYDRITRFIFDHSLYPAGHKQLFILMRTLAAELGTSRLVVSKALNLMQQHGLVSLGRGCIDVPQLERLITQQASA